MLPFSRPAFIALFVSSIAYGVGCQGAAPMAPLQAPAAASASAPAPVATSAPSAEAASPRASAEPPPSPPSSSPVEDAPDDAGGPCAYRELPGTCTVQADKTFVFTGNVDGKSVTLKNNTLDANRPRPALGKPLACSIKFMTEGTCTPCRFSIGSCGEPAADVFRAQLGKARR